METYPLPSAVQAAVDQVDGLGEGLLQEVIRVASIPAPGFEEQKRAAYVRGELEKAGLQAVSGDETGNVWGVLPGADHGRVLLVAAHMDTVFGPDIAAPAIDGRILRGPGVRDNSAAVAAVLQSARLLAAAGWRPACDVVLAGTVGEEGRGDLRGMKALFARWRSLAREVLVVDGAMGRITHIAVGSRRILVSLGARGGHSWQDYPAPSAVHAMGRAIHDISSLSLPTSPRTTVNVGVVSGGTSVNVIAEAAQMQVDMRSVDMRALDDLAAQVQAILERRAAEGECTLAVKVIGERPAGSIPADHPLVQRAKAVLQALGVAPDPEAGSTDANVPLSQGIPAVGIGASTGKGVHTLKEYLEIDSLPAGLKQVLTMIGLMAG